MLIVEYFSSLRELLVEFPFVSSFELNEDARTFHEGYIKGRIVFVDNSVLTFREYVNISGTNIERYSYSFHYSTEENLVFRFDDTPHYPDLSSFPFHKHLSSGEVIASNAPHLKDVLQEIEQLLS